MIRDGLKMICNMRTRTLNWNTEGSYCELLKDSINIYLYGCVSLLALEVLCFCVCVFVCDNKSECQQKTTSYVRPQKT